MTYNMQVLLFSSIKNLANAQAKLRGHRYFGRAAVSFSLLLGSIYPVFFISSFTTRRIMASNGSLRCLICSFNALFIMV